jgi:hypothetical protein
MNKKQEGERKVRIANRQQELAAMSKGPNTGHNWQSSEVEAARLADSAINSAIDKGGKKSNKKKTNKKVTKKIAIADAVAGMRYAKPESIRWKRRQQMLTEMQPSFQPKTTGGAPNFKKLHSDAEMERTSELLTTGGSNSGGRATAAPVFTKSRPFALSQSMKPKPEWEDLNPEFTPAYKEARAQMRLAELKKEEVKRKTRKAKSLRHGAGADAEPAERIGSGAVDGASLGSGGDVVQGIRLTDKVRDAILYRRQQALEKENARWEVQAERRARKLRYLKPEDVKTKLTGQQTVKVVKDLEIRDKVAELRRNQRDGDKQARDNLRSMRDKVRRAPLLLDQEQRYRDRVAARINALWSIKESLDRAGISGNDFPRYFDQDELTDLGIDFRHPRPPDDYAA